MSGQYDNARHHVRHLMVLSQALGMALLTTGTNASDVEVLRVRIPRKITIDEAALSFQIGGTGSVSDGTGAITLEKATASATTAFGSVALGASMVIASKNSSAFTVTSTDFAAGDELLVVTQASTVDTSGVLGHIAVGWVENFPSTADPVTGL
ncbi:hypothetical protein KA005_70470 [bacterium]|nr:hypothetical protein [bacterium]